MTPTLSVEAVQEMVTPVWVTDDEVRPVGVVGATVSGDEVNVAVTDVFEVIVTEHVPIPEHPPPDQPAKVEPVPAAAVSVETVPEVTPETEHVDPQLIELPDEVTVPDPVPDLRTESE